ncbi:hypothetical protein [Cellulomonas fimi]|uniref:Uncharacterized protein n=1 Tax=Cellulomonas fimi (strain ATCC 484 / DSM 20113 / JCM 1341 / CCUG 24087 / LMG 16345 / NBRC 15513 / NCIMB 8980 / NCTC 7547 / NRS-133) TaxID=590998 RepID=F4H212_CELFA|nr:hypothetical protein [Cellulomonas fimi]AEE45182.1 hypothetical protein Celf_1045 [Cellulomonas fimi ATCC 484]NNH06256.1 hypothetical protein [Cellulomonas fimi]VEH28489.1 Uncharacterised protein [Cellulomonas fimi]
MAARTRHGRPPDRADGSPRPRAAAALVVAVVGTLAGCAGAAPEMTDAPEARVSVQADCLDGRVVRDLGLVPDEGGSAGASQGVSEVRPGAVPEGFAPVSVLVCSASGTLRSVSGTWAAVTESRREGDLAPLLDALERPSQEPTGTCQASGAAAPTVLWLVDALGRAVRPVWPTDACGVPVAEVQDALDALDETDSTDYPVERVEPTAPSGR